MAKLALINKKGAYHLNKVLKSAVANAKVKGYDESRLFIHKSCSQSWPSFKEASCSFFWSSNNDSEEDSTYF